MQEDEFIGRRLVVHLGNVVAFMRDAILMADYVWMLSMVMLSIDMLIDCRLYYVKEIKIKEVPNEINQ